MKLVNKLKFVTGTGEWATHEANIATGCPNGCLYCYARFNAVTRFKSRSLLDWTRQEVAWDDVLKFQAVKYDGPIMFPTRHDIVEGECLNATIVFLEKLLREGNQVMVVTKPRIDCINTLLLRFSMYRELLHFRLTIGTTDSRTMSVFEPYAPSFAQRIQCLHSIKDAGFRCSVSSEPILGGTTEALKLFEETKEYVTDGVWLGPMNKIRSRIPNVLNLDCLMPRGAVHVDRDKLVDWIESKQKPEELIRLYNILKDEPNVRWKNEIKKLVGLSLNEQPGMDK